MLANQLGHISDDDADNDPGHRGTDDELTAHPHKTVMAAHLLRER